MYERLKDRGRKASDHYAGTPAYFSLTPASRALLLGLRPVLVKHCTGTVLDAGAGRGAYRDLLSKHSTAYVGLDVAAGEAVSVTGDVQRLPFADGVFDTVFCSQVLEHVPEPGTAITEFRRVLKREGRLILTVPHISWLHNEPHDYFRFTPHGLRHLLKEAGFSVQEIAPAGGLLALLGHIFSTLLMNLTYGIPLVHPIFRAINAGWVALVVYVDRHLERKKIFALNYVCSAWSDQESPSSREA